jgi:hypothetical protein
VVALILPRVSTVIVAGAPAHAPEVPNLTKAARIVALGVILVAVTTTVVPIGPAAGVMVATRAPTVKTEVATVSKVDVAVTGLLPDAAPAGTVRLTAQLPEASTVMIPGTPETPVFKGVAAPNIIPFTGIVSPALK